MPTRDELRVLAGELGDLLLAALADVRRLQDLLASDPLKVIHAEPIDRVVVERLWKSGLGE